jgi:radical SAM-linked protein
MGPISYGADRRMVPQPQPLVTPGPHGPGPETRYCKVRLRFRKGGDLRLVSHHDLMRCFERMLRRAGLPYRSTAGFNPKPRVVFASALSLGIVGCEEVVELEINGDVPAEEVRSRLAAQAPPGLEILAARPIEPKATARVRLATYRIVLAAERRPNLPGRIAGLLAAPHLWVERERPEARRLDLRPYLHDVRLGDTHLEMDLLVTPNGSARPDEILDLLGLKDLLDAGAVLERIHLRLHDEDEAPSGGAPCP